MHAVACSLDSHIHGICRLPSLDHLELIHCLSCLSVHTSSCLQGSAIAALVATNASVSATFQSASLPKMTTTFVDSMHNMHVAYAAAATARIWSAHPNCTASAVRKAMQLGAMHLGTGTGRNEEFGYGLVQMVDSLAALSQMPCTGMAASD